MATQICEWRYQGQPAKIGIRPTIDGRREGVRESLEERTMAMARSAGDFLRKNVKNVNGAPIDVVIADTCIGGVTEAAATRAKFEREGVGLTLTVTPCWDYGSETMDMNLSHPHAV